jgi:precorrin-3B synthase
VPRIRDDDACPGVLRLHQAADGPLMRVRLPGGALRCDQLQTLAVAARDHGAGMLELTGRGNLQLRGVTNAGAVADALAAADLLPSPDRERPHTIAASPLSGRVGDFADVRGLTADLDSALLAAGDIGLPGRFWVALDDGRGDVAGLGADIGARLAGDVAELQLTGRDTGVRIPAVAVADALAAAAGRFAVMRGNTWRAAELTDPTVLVDDATLGSAATPIGRAPVGWIEQTDGRVALGAGVPLGGLPARTAEFLAAIEAPLVITPWRSVLVCDLDERVADAALRVLAPMGLIFDENSPWLAVSACTGSPGCSRSLADVRTDAACTVESGDAGARHRHYVGCERACGSPPDADVLIATADGYRTRAR